MLLVDFNLDEVNLWQSEPVEISVLANSVNRCVGSLTGTIDVQKLLFANVMDVLSTLTSTVDKINLFSTDTAAENIESIESCFQNVDSNFLPMEPKRLAKSISRLENITTLCFTGSLSPSIKKVNATHLHRYNPTYQEEYLSLMKGIRLVSSQEEEYIDQPIVLTDKYKVQKFPTFAESFREFQKKTKMKKSIFSSEQAHKLENRHIPPGFLSQCTVVGVGNEFIDKKNIAFLEFSLASVKDLNAPSENFIEYTLNWFESVSARQRNEISYFDISVNDACMKGYLASGIKDEQVKSAYEKYIFQDYYGFNSCASIMRAIQSENSAVVVIFDAFPKVLLCGVWD